MTVCSCFAVTRVGSKGPLELSWNLAGIVPNVGPQTFRIMFGPISKFGVSKCLLSAELKIALSYGTMYNHNLAKMEVPGNFTPGKHKTGNNIGNIKLRNEIMRPESSMDPGQISL